jgi:hypothetical protein
MDDIDRNAPATRGDIADLLVALRDAETKLLTAFTPMPRATTSECSKARPMRRYCEPALR